MFNFVAVLFMLTHGVAADEPTAIVPYKPQTFQTLEACMAFGKTDAGKAAMALFDVSDEPLTVKFGCQQAEDNTI